MQEKAEMVRIPVYGKHACHKKAEATTLDYVEHAWYAETGAKLDNTKRKKERI